MIEAKKREKAGWKLLDKPEKGCWINCTNALDLPELAKYVNLPEQYLSEVQDLDEIPFVEKEQNELLLLLRIPIKTPDPHLPYRTVPLGIVLTKNYFVTICLHENAVITRLAQQSFTIGIDAVLKTFYASARTYLAYLKDISKEIHSTEQDLEKSTKNKDLLELFEMEKSLIYFSASISNNRVVLERINKMISGKDKDLLEDAAQEYKQAANTTKIHSITLTVMMDAFGSVISNNLNTVIKTLTVITIILMLPTLVASIYGMNVELPFQHSPNAFAITITISIIFSILGAIVFRKVFFK